MVGNFIASDDFGSRASTTNGTKIAPFSVLMNIQWKILETLQMDWFNKISTLKGGEKYSKKFKNRQLS